MGEGCFKFLRLDQILSRHVRGLFRTFWHPMYIYNIAVCCGRVAIKIVLAGN